ncbi:hypothetical protein LCW13_05830 [Cobetia amphilecti]|uniref:hypothetical protein n=1 Tax=Cobetia amphilecti TaxID=1055104 RepID=UPI001CDAF238|nr:hypothetical protein [Cobetia amphilecti]UBU49775.1 hypothetical protein LCW13_05830 [Cobetia amphilecti]
MTRDQLMESLLHLPHPWPRPETECNLPTDNGHGDLEGWIKGPTNNEWHYAWIGAHERRIVITREQWEEALLAHVQHLERPVCDAVPTTSADEVDPGDWNGDGLPPVGAVVEVSHGWSDKWVEARIIYIDSRHTICTSSDSERTAHLYTANNDFRPIHSERETAIEDMKQITKAAADAHKRELHGALSEEYLLGALYDAGHRKVTP